MFETSAGNGAVVAEWAALVPKPSGSSLTYEVYRRLPNDTDFTELKRLKTAGLNFAFVGGQERYHTPGDNTAALDRGSLQHHGEAALRLTRQFATMDLGSLGAGDVVYFALPLLKVVPRYSTLWALPIAGALLILFAGAVAWARRRKAASIGGIILAAVIFAAFAGGAGYLGWRYGRLAAPLHARWLPEGNVLLSGPYATAFVALIITAWLALYVLLRKKLAAHSIALGSAFVLLLAAAAASWFAAGASYVFAWPLAGALLGVLVTASTRTDTGLGAGAVLLLWVLAIPATLIAWPLAHAFFVTMGLAPESGLAMAVATVTGLGALVLPAEVIVERRRWWPAGVALLVVLAAVGIGALLTRYSERHPKPANVFYVLDADAKQASWAVKVDQPDPWFRQFLGPSPRPGRPAALVPPWSSVGGVAGFLQNDAPVLDLPAPRAWLVSTVPTEGGRNVKLMASPGRDGNMLSVWVNGVSALDVSVDGRRVDGAFTRRAPDDTAWTLEYYNAPASGVTVALTLRGTQPLTVAVVERAPGLPIQPGLFVHTTRPGSLFPIQAGDQTVVRRTYTF
jgi:hypothetical protein